MSLGTGACLSLLLLVAPAAGAEEHEYTIRYNGVRCKAAPCPTLDATPVAGGKVVRLTGLDLSAVGGSERGIIDRKAIVRGTVVVVPLAIRAETLLRVTRVRYPHRRR